MWRCFTQGFIFGMMLHQALFNGLGMLPGFLNIDSRNKKSSPWNLHESAVTSVNRPFLERSVTGKEAAVESPWTLVVMGCAGCLAGAVMNRRKQQRPGIRIQGRQHLTVFSLRRPATVRRARDQSCRSAVLSEENDAKHRKYVPCTYRLTPMPGHLCTTGDFMKPATVCYIDPENEEMKSAHLTTGASLAREQ